MKSKDFIRGFVSVLALVFFCNTCFAAQWNNDLRSLFINNKSIIYALNIRSFGAKDLNGNDIIEVELGDTTGTFLNAIPRLKELTKMGINTVYLLPITKTGKLKALGTAGSLYALDSFDKLNPQLDDKSNPMSVEQEAKMFFDEAHRLGLRVIVDIPSCGSYDMSLEKPDLFIKDKSANAVVPADWTDVRLFKMYDENGKLNNTLVDNYKTMITMLQNLGADGIRADVAAIKPHEFWKEVIDYARLKDPQILFIAEACPTWTNPIKQWGDYTSVERLLEAGFDGYYGDWANFDELTKSKDIFKRIKSDMKISKQFNNQKTTMASFATHDQQSVIVRGGLPMWEMITWLNITLPMNPYFLDGYPTGDNYIYQYENKKAQRSYTDDDYYFVHRGKFDIFNLSRRPEGQYKELKEKFVKAMKFKYWAKSILIDGKFIQLSTNNPSIFAYARKNGDDAVVVIGNLSKEHEIDANVYIRNLRDTSFISPVKMGEAPIVKRGKMQVKLKPYETQVYLLNKVNF